MLGSFSLEELGTVVRLLSPRFFYSDSISINSVRSPKSSLASSSDGIVSTLFQMVRIQIVSRSGGFSYIREIT